MTEQVRKTAITLADGRDLFYFDDEPAYVSGEKTRETKDPRPLPDRFAPVIDEQGEEHPIQGPEMRYDQLTGDWIPMATARMNRTFLPPANANPLAPANPASGYTDGEIPADDYDVVVFENRFPSMMRVPGVPDTTWFQDDQEIFPVRPASGRCEVICFTPNVEGSLAGVSETRMRTVIEAWADRTAELSTKDGIEQVFCFENHGEEIGVTLHHPHGQIYAYPFITPKTRSMVHQATEYRQRTGRNLLSDIVAAERAAETRIILENDSWVAYVPEAARWPVEVHLAPKREVPDLPALTDKEKDDLAPIYLEMLRRGDRFFVDEEGNNMDLPYIAAWHQAPVNEAREDLRLHLQFFSIRRASNKLKYLAGSESGMAAWISDTTPEKIAARFHELGPVQL